MDNKKSEIQSKSFYKEANDLQEGWGDYLREIDKLKDKVNNQSDITLKEAQWVMYGQCYCSHVYKKFGVHCATKGWKNKKMPWEAWNGLFSKYCSTLGEYGNDM